jgi:hypothetical protein
MGEVQGEEGEIVGNAAAKTCINCPLFVLGDDLLTA